MPVWQHSQQSSSSVQNIPNHSQIYLNETNIFKVLLERLFWFTWQHRRISWTCGTGNKQCKFRQNIKWIGLENCRINNMRLKCRLHSTYSWIFYSLFFLSSSLWEVFCHFSFGGFPCKLNRICLESSKIRQENTLRLKMISCGVRERERVEKLRRP